MMETDTAMSERNVPVVEAEQVYLLMKDNVRISRNSRASWYFKHLNSTIKPKAKTVLQQSDSVDKEENAEDEETQEKPNESVPVEEKKKEEEEFEILSVVPRAFKWADQYEHQGEYKVTADTNIVFVAKRYNLIFVLDISPSAAAPDLQCKTILLEQIFESLCNVIKGVAKPIRLPGYDEMLQPQLYITVVACSPLISRSASRVLIQGHVVNANNVQSLLHLLKSRFCEYEVGAAESMASVLHGQFDDDGDSQKMTGGIFDDIVDRPVYPDRMDYMMTADVGFINMIRYGMLALQLLPENSAAGIVMLTDGVVGVPEASVFESLMSQLRHNTISCSFIPVSSQFSVGLRLGQVPYVHLLQFIATATLGAYFSKTPDVESLGDVGWNVYHRGLLSWSFQVSIGGQKVDSLASQVWQELDEDLAWSSRSIKSSDTEMWLTPLMKKKHTERTLQISLAHLISCRLREGYIIKDVQIKKGDSEITVVMVLPWRDNVWIYYEAHSNWPLSQMKRHTRVAITVEASYEFLHDVTCPLKKPFKSPYRTSLVKKYWQTLQVMSETDMMLGHLQSFASNPTYYRVPESVMNGVPLFFLPANSSNPQLSLQHSSKDTSLNQFATFWKAVLHLDGNAWQKWLHTQRLSVILAHDVQLGKHLHIPNSSDRYHTITCRQSLTNLHFCLISWTTFVLLENHSYIKLLFDDPDKPPVSFFVLRLTLKPPCMVMRVAFLGGTPGHLRRKTMEELVGEINKLTFPQRGAHTDDKVATHRHHSGGKKEPVHVPPLQRQLSERLCCIISRKPMEMILIRYERPPTEFIRDLPGITNYSTYGKAGSANTSGSSVQFMLSQYLYHQRWVWSIQHGMSLPIPMQAVGRILSSLTKIRLQEGFMFAHAASGIINMVLEVDMKLSDSKVADDSLDYSEDPQEGTTSHPPGDGGAKPCVLQYVVFPPHTTTNKHESESEDDGDDRQDTAEADGDLQIITEVWVEPECGDVINSTPERKHFDGLNYKELAQAMFPTDLECVSTMVTFEHLQLMCQSLSSSFSTGHDMHGPKISWSIENLQPATGLSSSIHIVPFNLDVMRLLPKCQQVELLFSTYIQDVYKLRLPFKVDNTNATESDAKNAEDKKSDNKGPNDRLFDLFLQSMKDQHDLELHLSDSDCERVLRLIRERDRDPGEHPLPFVLEDDNTLEGFEGSCNRSESTISVATSVTSSHVSSNTTLVSNKPGNTQPTLKRALTNQIQRRLSVGSGLPRERNEDSLCLDETKSVLRQADVEKLPKVLPRWRCFVKHVCANHIILCFIPATYDDLRFLVQGQAVLRMAEIFQMMTNAGKDVREATSDQTNVEDGADPPGDDQVVKVHCSGKTHVETPAPVATKTEAFPTSSKISGTACANLEKAPASISINYKEQAEDTEISETVRASALSSAAEQDLVTSTPKQSPQKMVNSECGTEVDEDSRTDTQCETLDDVTVQHDAGDHFSPPSSYKSFPIPVYVYNCPLSSLTDQLVNKWTYVKPPDLYQDMNIIREEQYELSKTSSREDVTVADSQDEVDQTNRRRQDSETLRDRLSTMKEEFTSESSNGDQDSLKQHCTLISEYYLRCFVIGIFQSLLHSQEVTDKDIDAAINAICEESLPRETDLTRYLQNVCGHVRKVIKKATVEQVIKDDLMKTLPKPVDSALSPESQDSGETNKGLVSDDESEEANKSNLPHLGSVKVPLTLLQCDSPCESMPNLHKVIKEKFTAILYQYFHPVQAIPDYRGYFFYCPANFWRRRGCSDAEKSEGIDLEHSGDVKMGTSGDESDIFQSDLEEQEEQTKKSEQDSVTSNKDSASIDSLSAGDLDLDGIDEEDEDDFEHIPPLFINLTCSVRTSLGKSLHSVAVTDLPTCFGELKSCLKDLPEEVDLQDIEVTLDMICLTLPPEVDEEMPQKRPCFNRLTSFTSQVDVDSDPSPSPEERDDGFSFAATLDNSYIKQNSADIIKSLPRRQRAAIDDCQKQIQWLLQDEIASALRLMLPVSADTLEMVANHVNNSVDRPNCIVEEVPLQFVFGPEQSQSHFIEDFERMDLPGYHLQKEGKYYFLSLNRVHAHAEALRCAMENLKGEPSPVNVKPSPGKLDMDASVEILPKSTVQDDAADAFNPEDIKIAVIRPSPVKEVNPQLTDEQVAKKIADDEEGGSSDSSIQVLDPAQAEEPTPVGAPMVKPGEFKLAPVFPPQVPIEEKKTAPSEGRRRSSEDAKVSGPPSTKTEEDKGKKREEGEKSHADTNERRKRRLHRKSGDSPLTRSFDNEQKPHAEVVTRSQSEESAEPLGLPGIQRQLSPLTVAGVESKNPNMRRVHSSASFEKYRQGHSNYGHNTSKSGGTTPSGRPSDVQTPTRSHHPSGLHTPVSSSMYYPSSRSSLGEEGYEGDSSDLDEDGAMMSFSDRGNTRLLMPNFWLIMEITQDKVHVFFHARDSHEEESEESIHQKNLYNNVIDNINEICKIVNQRLLLRDLNETRMCNKLLVCEADEDVRWAKDKYHSFRSRKTEDSDDSDTDAPQDRYLHAALKLMPGHFACDKVCTISFVLHPRLKTVNNRSGSRGVQALLSVLNKFSVSNRKNLFVIKDTSENVFYLRLEEGQKRDSKAELSGVIQKDGDLYFASSRSSSLLSLPTKKFASDLDDDGPYHNTRHYSIGEKPGDVGSREKGEVLHLTVHGITPASAEITQDLTQLLRKKLDDVVLDILTVMLARNPMCKLMPEDVEFIQLVSKPKEVVRLTIPSVAMLQQYALGYYLRQNLLQFLSTPKYADPRQATVFRDFSQPGSPPIPDNVVFLYNRPQQAGGKGIACLQMQFVDGRGTPVQLLSGPKPSLHAYKDPLDRSDFEKLVNTSIYQVSEGAKKPDDSDASSSTDDQLCHGPTALVQFNIWERGDVDMYQLRELLVKGMKHAACDVIMEYQLLTAPLCEVPMQPLASVPEPVGLSGTASPKLDTPPAAEARSHEPLKRMPSDKATPKDKSATFNILSDVFKSKNRDSPRDSPASPVPSEVDETKKKEMEVEAQRVLKYEQGDRGTLNPVFMDVLPTWLEFANSLDVPSIQRSQFTLVSRTAVDYVLKEFQSTVNKIVSDINPRVFRFVDGVAGATNPIYIPYSPTRAPMSAQDTKLESSMDFASHAPCGLPGRSCSFIGVGRNVNQWKASIHYTDYDDMTSEITAQNNPKTHKGHQRFPPYDPTIYTVDKGEGGLSVPPTPTVANVDPLGGSGLSPKEAPFSSKGPDFTSASDALAALSAAVRVFVPRQRFILLTVQDKEFCLYTYNWPSEHNSHLEKHMTRVIQWHNARDHLLSCILAQKMGLFQHVLFGEVPSDPQTSFQENNPFIQNVGEIDTLVRYTSPMGPTLQPQQTRSRQPSSAITPPVLFEDLYRDTKPSVAMHKATYGNLRDPLHKHGAQMMELRNRLRKEADRNDKLGGLYMMWQQRMGSTPISEDVLELLKTSSRLVHSVATPLLFSPQWRRRVVPKPTTADVSPQPVEPKQARSRHSSGASIRSKRSDSMDGKIRIGVDSPEPSSSRQVPYEEGWHMDLRHSFMNQYMQYLQSLLFIQINTRPPTPRRTTSRQRSGEKANRDEGHNAPFIHKDFMYLQKTFPGGIILLELGFKDLSFCVNVYAFECSRLPVGKTVNPQLAVIFTEELDKFKDLTHVHSFAHDFHLRIVQTYIGTKQQMVFKHGYHLTNFLHDFITVFPYVPSFSRNFIYEAMIQIDNTNSPGNQLFDYMLNHDRQYGMRAIRMIPCDNELDQEHEYALVMQFHCDEELCEVEIQRARPQDYEVGLVLTHQPGPRYSDLERHTLRLKFFIVLTSKMEMFPRDKLEKKLWAFKSGSLRRYTARGTLPTSASNCSEELAGFANLPLALMDESATRLGFSQQLGISEEEMGSWNETINYLGYSNKHQAVGYILLRRLADIAKSKVQHMVENAMQQCRRDSLWRRMLLPPTIEDEGRRKRRSERQPDADDNFLTLLTFAEFEELLDIVSQERLERLDPRLAMLQNMGPTWYQGLIRVMISKYQDNHRSFSNNEGSVKHLVVLNPNHLDAFMMLTIENNKASLKAVYREAMPELHHTPDNPNLPALAMQNHIEGFVNACCYHMWSVLTLS